jgi:serine/threonine-protein kinase RsbW
MATMRLYATASHLAAIREFVAQAGRDTDLSEQAVVELQLAVDEICTNVIRHGYGGQGGEIEVQVVPVEDGARVTVRDWGKAFDPRGVPTPDVTAPLECRPFGGLGLYLVRQVMDQVRFEFDAENGNTVTMLKRSCREEKKG